MDDLTSLVSKAAALTQPPASILFKSVNADTNLNSSIHRTAVHHEQQPNFYTASLYGFLAIFAISLLPLLALAMRPLAKKPYYRSMLLFLMSMGVGILFATSFLFLLPTAIDYKLNEFEEKTRYVVKISTYFGTFLFFLNFEIVFKQSIGYVAKRRLAKQKEAPLLAVNGKPVANNTDAGVGDSNGSVNKVSYRKNQKQPCGADTASVVTSNSPSQANNPQQDDSSIFTKSTTTAGTIEKGNVRSTSLLSLASKTGLPADAAAVQITRASSGMLSEVASIMGSMANITGEKTSVVWIILAADGIHSFVDGVAIGSAIVNNLLEGLTMALVIFVEELPHKLGDVAVILNAGVPNCRAIVYAWFATLPCFFGYVVGVVVGNILAESVPWIYTIAGAIFLYTAVTDILPEVVERVNGRHGLFNVSDFTNDKWYKQVDMNFVGRLILQNTGLMFGYTIAAILAVYESNIKLA